MLSSPVCCASASSFCHSLYSFAIAAGFTLAVALMQPAPPPRSAASRNVSEPGNTSKPCGWKSSNIALVLSQLPELSLTPAMMPGNSFSKRSISVRVIGTLETWDVVQIDPQAVVANPLDQLSVIAEQTFVGDAFVVERRQHQHTAGAYLDGFLESSTESDSAQHPVPGIMRAPGMPACANASNSSNFSRVDREFASELVPNTASPTSLANSH